MISGKKKGSGIEAPVLSSQQNPLGSHFLLVYAQFTDRPDPVMKSTRSITLEERRRTWNRSELRLLVALSRKGH